MKNILAAGVRVLAAGAIFASGAMADDAPKLRAQIGAYYFDGWAGRNKEADNPAAAWAKDMPTHVTKRLLDEFGSREPAWGWRDDTAAIMERQIDLAADHGLAFWSFCWYFHPDEKAVADDPKHTGMKLFVAAKNNSRMKFCLMVANHAGYMLKTPENWKKAAEMWLPYLKHPSYLTADGKPLVVIFSPQDSSKEGMDLAQAVAKSAGLPGITFAACSPNPPANGYAATTRYNVGTGWEKGYAEKKYSELIETVKQSWNGTPALPHIPCLVAGWDKRPWEKPATGDAKADAKLCWYFPDRTPELFAKHLADVIAWMDAHPEQATKERLAIAYAWNEFGEGGYIAPTKGDPDGGYLKALKSAVMRP